MSNPKANFMGTEPPNMFNQLKKSKHKSNIKRFSQNRAQNQTEK